MKLRGTIVLVAAGIAIAIAGGQSSQAAQDSVADRGATGGRDCSLAATETVVIVRAQNMTCGRAGRVMDRYVGSISANFKAGGFNCHQSSGSRLVGTWKCVNGSKFFRFSFAD